MSFGISSTGLAIKRLPDIKAEIEAALQDTFGKGVDLTPEGPFGQLIGILAERAALLWEQIEAVYLSAYPATAEGVPLDNAVALVGIARQGETFSNVTATFVGDEGTIIPQGSVVSVAGNPASRFVVDTDVTIGAPANEVQHIAFTGVPASGTWSLTHAGQTTTLLAYNAAASAVQTALRALSNLGADLTVSGNYTSGFDVTYLGDDGATDQPPLTVASNTLQTSAPAAVTVSVTTTTPGHPPQASGTLTAESAGSVHAPAGSLTVIETAVSGWDSVSNAIDAEVGDDIESDVALRLRAAASVQKAGAGTAAAIRADLLALDEVDDAQVFENVTLTTDGFGRPPKSFEVIIEGGDDQEIAQTIWADKPAGIATHGNVTISITDSQGYPHDVKFSRPVAVPIYVELDLTTTSDYPLDGEDRVKTAVVGYGDTLGLGDDVIVSPALISALAPIPGIIGVTIRIGKTVSPTGNVNVAIDTVEIADFDTSRVTVSS